jgi:hypothetical protein
MNRDLAFKLAKLRGQIAELGISYGNCKRPEWIAPRLNCSSLASGGELERLMNLNGATATPPTRRG